MWFPLSGGIDYTGPTPSVITFSPGQTVGDENCIVVSVLDDSFIENKETFNLTLSVSSADVNSVAFSGQGISTFTITQDPNDSTFKAYQLLLHTMNIRIRKIIGSYWFLFAQQRQLSGYSIQHSLRWRDKTSVCVWCFQAKFRYPFQLLWSLLVAALMVNYLI